MSKGNANTEHELLSRIAEGDNVAFSKFYQQILPMLHAFLFKMLKSEHAVQEVIQETLVRIWLNRDKLEYVEYPKAWVSKIALNECYKFLRNNGLQHQVDLSENLQPEIFNEGANRLSLNETKQIITRAIEELPHRRKLIYYMSREQGLRIPEIAKELNLSPGYVKKALVLALQQLRKRLSESGRMIIFIFLLFFLIQRVP